MAVIVKGKNKNRPYTVRYWHEERQLEKSFRTSREAKDFQAKFEHDSRENIFVDPKLGSERFEDAAEKWVSRLTGAESSKVTYRRILRNHVNPAFGRRSLRSLAADREGVTAFLLSDLPAAGLGASQVRTAYVVIRAVTGDAVKAGKIPSTRLNGITLPLVPSKADFVFPAHEQLEALAAKLPEAYRLTVWLMRGCGLRIGEALAVSASDYHGDMHGGVLRITEQLLPDGAYGPLKHRKPGDHRDVPVPAYVAQMLPQGLTGHIFPKLTRRTYDRWYASARDAAGIPASFTPHSLRHVFASIALSNGVPITDVSAWLGHRNINTTYSIYGHLVPSSWEKARGVLDAEYETWREAA